VERERFLDAVTIWILEHLVEWHCLMRSCGEYNAAELPQAVSKTFPSTPPIHTTEAQMTKRFLAFEARHKGSSRFSGLPGVPPKVGGAGGREAGGTRRSHDGLVFRARSS